MRDRWTPTRLVVVQATPFCNIDCAYCYLDNRSDTSVITAGTLDAIVDRLAEWGHFAPQINVLWHAGEPLVLPASFYTDAFHRFEKLQETLGRPVLHSIQTNAQRVTDAHCEIFAAYGVAVGVSLDGPQAVHDKYRKRRDGVGTYDATVRGLKKLQEFGLNPSALAVLSKASLQDPIAFYNSFEALSVSLVGMNILEQEGANASTFTLFDEAQAEEGAYADFLRVLFRESLIRGTIVFRELAGIIDLIAQHSFPIKNSENVAGDILSFSHDGRVSTYSPELLGHKHSNYGSFATGNVAEQSIETSLSMLCGSTFANDIVAGVNKCERSCDYFAVCGGGSPSNKLGEFGTFQVAETMHCRFAKQITFDVAMEFIGDERYQEAIVAQATSHSSFAP